MIQLVKALDARFNNSPISGTKTVEGEHQRQEVVLRPPPAQYGMCPFPSLIKISGQPHQEV